MNSNIDFIKKSGMRFTHSALFIAFIKRTYYVSSPFFIPKIVLNTAPSIFGFKTITFITYTPYFLQRAKPQNTKDIARATMMNFVGRMKEITKPSPSDAKIIPAHEFLLLILKPPANVLIIHYIQRGLILLQSYFISHSFISEAALYRAM